MFNEYHLLRKELYFQSIEVMVLHINDDREHKQAHLRYRKNKLIHEELKRYSAIEKSELLAAMSMENNFGYRSLEVVPLF